MTSTRPSILSSILLTVAQGLPSIITLKCCLPVIAISTIALLSGCGGPRIESKTLTYEMIPTKRPAGATTYRIEAGKTQVPLNIPGMTAKSDADIVIEVEPMSIQSTWTARSNQIIYEAEGYNDQHKPIMLCREWGTVGLKSPAKAVPTVALIALWKQGGFTQDYQIIIKNRAGDVIDKDTIQAGTAMTFGMPTGEAKSISIIGSSNYATTKGGVMSSLSGQSSAQVVQNSAQDAMQAIPYHHAQVWAQGQQTTSVGQPVVAEKSVLDWFKQMSDTPSEKLEADFAAQKLILEKQAEEPIKASATDKINSMLTAKLGSGKTSRSLKLAIYEDDGAFQLFSQAIQTGDRNALATAQLQMETLSNQADIKPLKKAVAHYALAQIALGLGNTEKAQQLARQAADEALALRGGLIGPGNDDFTVIAMDFSIELGGGESGNAPKSPAAQAEPSALKKTNNFLSGLGF